MPEAPALSLTVRAQVLWRRGLLLLHVAWTAHSYRSRGRAPETDSSRLDERAARRLTHISTPKRSAIELQSCLNATARMAAADALAWRRDAYGAQRAGRRFHARACLCTWPKARR